jgi:hypothetical protein
MGLEFIRHPQNLDVECGLRAEEDVAIGIRRAIPVVRQLGIGTDLAIVACNELE